MADGFNNFAPRLRPNLQIRPLSEVAPLGTLGSQGIRPLGQAGSPQVGTGPIEIGGGNAPSTAQPDFTPQQVSELRTIGQRADALPEELRKEYVTSQLSEFRRRNIPEAAQSEVLDVVYEKGRFAMPRHKSVLSRLAQAMQVIESSGAGFMAGYMNYIEKSGSGRKGAFAVLTPSLLPFGGAGLAAGANVTRQTKQKPGEKPWYTAVAPWVQYHAYGAGFKDVAPAVHEGYTYADLVKQQSDPNSMAYRWSQPIGIGMSILFDPLTYMTFGTGSVGKEAAYQVLARQELHAYSAADEAIRAGKYGGDFNRIHEAAMDMKVKNGYAMTMGDALDQLHETGLALKQQIRTEGGYLDPISGKFVEASGRQKAGAWLAPTAAIGARGIRFAGVEIPGTATAGERVGKALRGTTFGSSPAAASLRTAGAAVIPDWAARHVAGDGLRASALVEMASWRAQQQALGVQIGKEVRGLQKVKTYPTEDAAAATHISGTPEVLKTTPAQRRDLMALDPEAMPEGPLKNLRVNIQSDADHFINQAVEAGGDREDLMRTWRFLSQKAYHDPLAALFDFKLKTSTQIAAKNWTDHVLKDRRFALPMYAGSEAKTLEDAAFEVPTARGALRPVHISPRAVVTTEDGIEHTMPRIDPKDFVEGTLTDIDGTPIRVDDIRQVRNSADELIWREHGYVPTGMGTKYLREVPSGYQAMSHAGRRYAVVDSVADALRKVNNPVSRDMELKRFFGLINAPQNWWKIYATAPNPSFHVMNFLGAMWNNQLAGVYNPMDYIAATATLLRGRREEAAQRGETFMKGLFETKPMTLDQAITSVPESSAGGRAAHRTLSEAENRTGLGRSAFLFADISRGEKALPRDVEASIGTVGKPRSPLANIVAPPEGSSAKQIARFYGTKRARQAAAGSLIASGNPLGLFLLAPEAAKVGQKMTGVIEDVVRLAPFMKYSKDPTLRQVLHQFGPITMDGISHPRWSKAEQSAMYDIGAAITSHFQFDYTNLTDTERYVAKTVFPFWSYYKNNFMLQAREVVKQPRSFMAATALMNYIGDQGQDMGPYAAVLPQYFENIQAFQVPVPGFARDKLGLPHNQPLYLNPKMPFLSLNLIPPMWDIINDPHETTSQKLLESLAPIMGSWGPLSSAPIPFIPTKLLLEAGTGHNLGLNRPIDYQRVSSNDYRQSYVDAPSWAQYMPKSMRRFLGVHESKKSGRLIMTATNQYILEQISTPFINNLGQSIPTDNASETGKAKAKADMVSWITGVRLIPVDTLRLSRNDAYTMKNILEAKQSELRQQGKDLNDKDYEILQEVKYDLEGINAAWDEREGITPNG